ncbi:MAG: adenylate/guanylate cyclase domain-containing protein [Pyrinomonadaceae bacterium]
MGRLKVTDASGREWEQELLPHLVYTIGRSPSNQIVLRDPRTSRHHAQIRYGNGCFTLIDGYEAAGEVRRSVNRVFVNGEAIAEKQLTDGDEILVGASKLIFEKDFRSGKLNFDDRPLGRTQLLLSSDALMQSVKGKKIALELQTDTSEIEDLRRKAKILELLYEMSKTLTGAFDLQTIFAKATDVIFEATPADRVVALLKVNNVSGSEQNDELYPIATKTRSSELSGLTGKLTISRTITHKVMSEGLALLSQDARTDAEFSGVDSIVTQGVRSTICAPLMTESGVHGAIYADRLDPFAAFTADDLALISAVTANTAVVVETIRAHERLAREQVARANYSRFLPPYVVQQLLEKPESFALGGTNQIVTVLFADIRGFTRLSEREKPEKILQLLNRYFSEMTELIFMHGGTLDKYIGDGLMALFGAPTASPQDATNSVRTAIAMQRRLQELNIELKADGFEELGIGIGLHTGEAIVGYIGCEKRSEYTAIGDTVNLAARLEANALAGQILMSGVTAAALRDSFSLVPRDSITVRNRVQTVPLFEVQWK